MQKIFNDYFAMQLAASIGLEMQIYIEHACSGNVTRVCIRHLFVPQLKRLQSTAFVVRIERRRPTDRIVEISTATSI